MITVAQALIAGLVQGITEFLPVSSSGHLVLVHGFFGFKAAETMLFDIWLHGATLGAVIFFFRKELMEMFLGERRRWLVYISLATVPGVLTGLLLESRIRDVFRTPRLVGGMLLVTALFLFGAEIALRRRKTPGRSLNVKDALLVGCAQALALMPGISRSGSTISTAVMSDVERREAFSFSFLLSVPIIIGALIYKVITSDVALALEGNGLAYLSGSLVAFVTSFLSLRVLWATMRKSKLYLFGIYCSLLGTVSLVFF